VVCYNLSMNAIEPVHKNRRGIRIAAVAALSMSIVLGGSQLAIGAPSDGGSSIVAASSTSSKPKVTVKFASPSLNSTVHDTLEISLTGTNLKTVKIYRLLRLVATATVGADGTTASAVIDTTAFRDGPLLLTAAAWGSNSAWPKAVAALVVKVGNANADFHPAGYAPLFSDEFSGTSLDRSKWCTRYMYDGGPALQVPDASCLHTNPANGTTYGNLDTLGHNGQEQEVYRDFNVDGLQMHTVQNGYVALHATATRPGDPENLDYESAMLRSKLQFQPTEGHPIYLTARMKLPDVLGTWPAFWLAGGYGPDDRTPNWPPEIDILESPLNTHESGVDGHQGENTMHVGVIQYGCGEGQDIPECPQQAGDFTDTVPSFDTQWGNYVHSSTTRETWVEVGLDWSADHLCWYFDGQKIACEHYVWVANEGPDATNTAPILLNLAVGGPWAGESGVEDNLFPTEFDIDHVRVYQK
jgi:beta-glucanase (GH16 family)